MARVLEKESSVTEYADDSPIPETACCRHATLTWEPDVTISLQCLNSWWIWLRVRSQQQVIPQSERRSTGAGGGGLRMDLVDAGVGAAGTTVPSLATLNHTGHLQTCHHWETAIPHLQGQHNDSRVKWKAKQRCYETDTWKQTWIPHHESWNYWLWELWFEGMHQLLSFGIVERE